MSCNGTDGADGCGERMDKVNRNVLETKADLRLADKIDEIVRRLNELEGGQSNGK